MRIMIILLLCFPLLTLAQVTNQKLIGNLSRVSDMPYACETNIGDIGCGDRLFWKVVNQKQTIIPDLIDKLTDTTTTKASVPYFGGNYTVADVAYVALEEIIKGIPTFELLGVAFDKEGCGYCSYYNHLRKNIQNRRNFKMAVSRWYSINKSQMVWVKSKEFMTCDCTGQHPNGGHFEVKKQKTSP